MLKRFAHLRIEQQVALLVGLLCVMLVSAVTAAALWIGRRDQVDLINQQMTDTAVSMAGSLDRGMFERYREIQNLSRLAPLRDDWLGDPARLRQLLDTLKASLPVYAWIGFALPDGTVRAAAEGTLEGASVSARPWFHDGMQGPALGDVHEAKLLSQLLGPTPDGEPFRLVDVAMPVKDDAGATIGVLGAHLSWRWAADLRQQLQREAVAGHGTEIWILNRDGEMVLGPGTLPRPFTPEQIGRMKAARRGVFENEEAGGPMLTGFAVSGGYRDYPGLGWIVIARRPTAVAFARAQETVRSVVLSASAAGGLGILLAWLLARRSAAPLRRLTKSAGRIGRDPESPMLPRVGGSCEVAELSAALRALLVRVGSAETALDETMSRSSLSTMRYEAEIETLRRQASRDPLTGLLNRRAFLEVAKDAFSQPCHSGRLALLMVDIDHFKRINDSYGHAVGDAVIQEVSRRISAALRPTDHLARFGGEEFVILLCDTDPALVSLLCAHIRSAVRRQPVAGGAQPIEITISIGAAIRVSDSLDLQMLIERADAALYRAKAAGRDCVRIDGTGRIANAA